MGQSVCRPLRTIGAGRTVRPAARRLACAVLGALCAIGGAMAGPPAAQLASTLPGWLQLETGLTVTPEVLQARWTALVRVPAARADYSLAAPAAAPAWGNSIGATRFFELGSVRAGGTDQPAYVRPHFALGESSEALRGWLRLAGIDATACTAPLMKMHSAFAGSTSRANVSLSARCSLH